MLNGKGFSGAAHAGHDFVCDEKNSAVAADFGQASDVAVGRICCVKCGADYGFEDEGGDGRCIICGEQRFEIVGPCNLAIGKSFVEGTVVAEAGRDVAPFRQKRLIGSAAGNVAADGHGAERAAVIALAARDDAEFSWRAGFEMELARKFDSGFGGFGTARGEVDAAVCEIGRRESKKPSGEFFRGGGVELRCVGEGDLGGLRGHGVGDRLDAVTDADYSGLARGIEIFLAVRRKNPRAFAADGDGKRFSEVAGEESGGVCGHSKEIVTEPELRRRVHAEDFAVCRIASGYGIGGRTLKCTLRDGVINCGRLARKFIVCVLN